MKTLKKVELSVVYGAYDLDLLENTVHVDQEKGYFALNCLGCGQFMHYPISPIHKVGWGVKIGGKGITVTPSILNGCCNAHYIITDGVANIV